jgi:hypothetical protein
MRLGETRLGYSRKGQLVRRETLRDSMSLLRVGHVARDPLVGERGGTGRYFRTLILKLRERENSRAVPLYLCADLLRKHTSSAAVWRVSRPASAMCSVGGGWANLLRYPNGLSCWVFCLTRWASIFISVLFYK